MIHSFSCIVLKTLKMKYLKYIISVFLLVVVANSCQKFDDLEADPNRSTTVPPSLVLRGVLVDMYNAPWGDEQRWNQYWCSNYNYYDNNEYWTGSANLRFTTLKNVQKNGRGSCPYRTS